MRTTTTILPAHPGCTTIRSERIFIVEEAPEGGYTARALGASIFTEADTWGELQGRIRDAVLCHF